MSQEGVRLLAGSLATFIFVGSNLPMLWKAMTTRDLGSYSLLHISLSNLGNMVNWVYVAGLPAGPVWWLHGFNTAVAALMFTWKVRYERKTPRLTPQLSSH